MLLNKKMNRNQKPNSHLKLNEKYQFFYQRKYYLNFVDFSVFNIAEIGKIFWNTSNTFLKSLFPFKIIYHESFL